jgi:hypothetical protein
MRYLKLFEGGINQDIIDKDYIEELLVVAYKKGKEALLMDVAGKIQVDRKVDRTKSFELVAKIRARKGLKEGIPALDNFLDKL